MLSLRRILGLALVITLAVAPLGASVCAVNCAEPAKIAVNTPSSHCAGMASEDQGETTATVGDGCHCRVDIASAPALKPGQQTLRLTTSLSPGTALDKSPVQVASPVVVVDLHAPPLLISPARSAPLRI